MLRPLRETDSKIYFVRVSDFSGISTIIYRALGKNYRESRFAAERLLAKSVHTAFNESFKLITQRRTEKQEYPLTIEKTRSSRVEPP